MSSTIRLATPADAEQVFAIYAPIVAESVISFEETAPNVAEMAHRIETTLLKYPWLVCEDGGSVLGYAYATEYRKRSAYRWSVETSVYVDAGARRRGVGAALYESLFALLELQGFVSAFAGIALPNEASIALHQHAGFEIIGIYRTVGFKLGGWHDVGWWQRPLTLEPLTPSEAQALAGWPSALGAGVSHLRPTPG
jgi:phosphinothricin acetyltransferase